MIMPKEQQWRSMAKAASISRRNEENSRNGEKRNTAKGSAKAPENGEISRNENSRHSAAKGGKSYEMAAREIKMAALSAEKGEENHESYKPAASLSQRRK